MDFISEINVIYVLAFSNALILFAVAAILRGEPRREPLPLEGEGQGDDVLGQAVLERLDGIGRRLEQLEGQLESVSAAAAQAPAPAAAGGTGGQRYGEALRLVGGGAAPDDLVSRCGLSRGEADLFVRLHGNRHRGEAAAVRRVS
ncbi:DUF2802 domain-containing protein [Lentisalinibacter salinarum]|uniref:DUF2802 domain-containing protein n=1 Tax=Lentisalinibacter salinarum TaxID=2992239 RepID=UPI00386C2909